MSTDHLIENYNKLLQMNKFDALRQFYDDDSRKLEDEILRLKNDIKNKKVNLSRELLIVLLKVLDKFSDPETAHGIADDFLIIYINDSGIEETFDNMTKWYA